MFLHIKESMRYFSGLFSYILYIFLSTAISVSGQPSGQDRLNDVGIVSAVEKYNDRDFKGASDLLTEILAADPSDDAAWYYLALSSLGLKDMELAETSFRKAVELDPDNFWYSYRLAALYSVTSRPELTVDIYERLLEKFPDRSELYYDLVEIYASQGNTSKALQMLDQIETVFGVSESLAIYRFNLLRMAGSNEDAYGSLEKYNSEYSSPYVLSTLADWQMSMYNDSTALAYYDEALDIAPDFSPALLGKAETLRMTRRYDEYFGVLSEYVSESDAHPAAKSEYLTAVVQRTDPKFLKSFMPQFDTIVDRTVSMHPSDSSVLRLAGVYYFSTDRNEQAKRYFKENVRAWPASMTVNAELVEFLMYAEDWKELSEEGRNAFARFPSETAFLEMASVGDYNMHEYQRVLDVCDKVLEVAPSDSSRTLRAWSTMGDIYFRLGEKNKAFKAYDAALKINPDYVYVLNNYAYYLSVEGKKLKKAHDMSRKTIEAEPDNATYLDTYGWILFLQGKPQEAKPHFKRAMLYGGKDSAVIMDHYAEVLFALKEYELAFVYWNLALQKNDSDMKGLADKIALRRKECGQNK